MILFFNKNKKVPKYNTWDSILFLYVGCKDKITPDVKCQKTLIIDSLQYKTAPNKYFSINDVNIEANCLKVDYSHCGSVQEGNLKLIDAQEHVDGFIHSRRLRFSFDKDTNCFAINSREQTFDISNLRQFHEEHIVLTISGFGKTVYQY